MPYPSKKPLPTPAINYIDPSSGLINGGTKVTIVLQEDIPHTVKTIALKKIICKSPKHYLETVTVSVSFDKINFSIENRDCIYYVNAPSVATWMSFAVVLFLIIITLLWFCFSQNHHIFESLSESIPLINTHILLKSEDSPRSTQKPVNRQHV
jgi:hypothetical protein